MSVFYGVIAGYALARCVVNLGERDWKWAGAMGVGAAVQLIIAIAELHGS